MNRGYIGVKEQRHLMAIRLEGSTGVTATVTCVPKFVTATGGLMFALPTETTAGAS
jgi:hypothetical protein